MPTLGTWIWCLFRCIFWIWFRRLSRVPQVVSSLTWDLVVWWASKDVEILWGSWMKLLFFSQKAFDHIRCIILSPPPPPQKKNWGQTTKTLGSFEKIDALPKTNSSPLKIGRNPKEMVVSQPRIFRGKLAVSFRQAIFWQDILMHLYPYSWRSPTTFERVTFSPSQNKGTFAELPTYRWSFNSPGLKR